MGLFKRNSLNVARIAPTKAVEFFVFDRYKEFILTKVSERWPPSEAGRPNPSMPHPISLHST